MRSLPSLPARPNRRGLQDPGRRLRSSVALGAVATLTAAGLAACSDDDGDGDSGSGNGTEASDDSGEWPRTVEFENGEVEIPEQPENIVSTSVTLTGSLLAIDAPVVGSGATGANTDLADENGFFTQWGDVAEERDVESLYNGEPDVESIATQDPDLIVVSSSGQHSASQIVDQLEDIAPTVVIDYGSQDWQGVATQLGEATGLEDRAKDAIDDFDTEIAGIADSITVPDGPVSSFVYQDAQSGANVFTRESAQNRLLEELGFTIADLPENVQGEESMGSRGDIIQVARENLSEVLNGETIFAIAGDDGVAEEIKDDSGLRGNDAVSDGEVYALGDDTFRLDAYSSMNMATKIQEIFG
ncbi:MAG: Fe2+-enterobactin ABC transporter substrate-binding protein [Mycobacteriaceae bacterium]